MDDATPSPDTPRPDAERWSVEHEGRLHEVHVTRRRLRLTAQWFVDGNLVGAGSEWGEETLVVSPENPDAALGAVGVKGPKALSATRRVVLRPTTPTAVADEEAVRDADEEHEDEDEDGLPAAASLLLSFDRGTVDLVPDPGTRAARRQDWILRHPRLHVVRETFTAGGAVLWGVIFFAVVLPVLERLLPRIPFPDLPSIPWPDIPWPSIPWPDIDLPSIPLPNLPDIDLPDLPDWLGTVLKLLFAVGVAGAVASSEVKRRREREQRAARERRTDQRDDPGHDGTDSSEQ